jgi:outer membrane receptor protein involved in Fe transport
MISGKYRILISVVLLFLLIVNVVIAGTTGKIAGRVVDKETNEPLIGANIVVGGTSLGASTDVNGYYTILSVPPGLYSIAARMVGYANVTVNEVRVLIDQTSLVDIQMTTQAIETGEVVVVAKRNLVKKDVTASVSSIQAEEIGALPVSNINDLVGLQAGVEEGMMIRGGGSDELLFQIDGITLRDPRNNKPISMIALSSIQEVSIERGGFNAEYGQVRSGIINIVEKEGDVARYVGSITTKYSPAQQKYFGMSVFDPNSMWNRPYLDTAVCWTGTDNGNWEEYVQRQYPNFIGGWNAISQRLLSDSDPTNDLSPAACRRLYEWTHRRRPDVESPDYIIDGSFGGPVPIIGKKLGNLRFFASFQMNREMLVIPLSRPDYKDYNWSLKLNSNINDNMKLMISGSVGKSYNVVLNADDRQFNDYTFGINGTANWNPTDYMRTPLQIAAITNEQRASRIFCDSWYSEANVGHSTLFAKLSSVISALTFYEISLEYVHTNYLTGPINPINPNQLYEVVPDYFVTAAPFGYDPTPDSDLSGMFYGGHSATARDSSKLNSYTFTAAMTSQLNNENMVKAGVEFSFYDLNLDYGQYEPFFGNVNWVKEHWQPYRFSVYAQDKIEAFGFIANIGLRLDMSNPNTEWIVADPFDKSFYSNQYDPNSSYQKRKAETDVSLSPRLGISHPITENSKLYFNYGYFKQMPAYEELFRVGRGPAGNMRNYGNPNLVQAKTISYQLGFDQVLFDTYLIQLAAFYNDITNEQSFTAYSSDRKSIAYSTANNNGYRDIRGFELTIRKSYGEWVRGFINYTYQVVTGGAFGKQQVDEDPSAQILIDENTAPLYQQKPVPQPRADLSLTFLTPKDFGPKSYGIVPLGNWSLNLIGRWRAGEYYTYNPNSIPGVLYNVQTTDYFNTDLRLNKTFDFQIFTMQLFMEVRNLFNFKRLSGESFYDVYDQQYYFQSLHLPESSVYESIPGDDRVGEYRKNGAAFQPIERSGGVNGINVTSADFNPKVIYYDIPTKRYMNYDVNSHTWVEVEKSGMQKILDDKAYIDMPNNTSFNFLNPRQIFYGVSISFKL